MMLRDRLNALPGVGGFLTAARPRRSTHRHPRLNALPGVGGFLTVMFVHVSARGETGSLNALPGVGGFLTVAHLSAARMAAFSLNALPGVGGFLTHISKAKECQAKERVLMPFRALEVF